MSACIRQVGMVKSVNRSGANIPSAAIPVSRKSMNCPASSRAVRVVRLVVMSVVMVCCSSARMPDTF